MNLSRIKEVMLPILVLAAALVFTGCGRSDSEAPVSANGETKTAAQSPR
jgi:hypothetical protein